MTDADKDMMIRHNQRRLSQITDTAQSIKSILSQETDVQERLIMQGLLEANRRDWRRTSKIISMIQAGTIDQFREEV